MEQIQSNGKVGNTPSGHVGAIVTAFVVMCALCGIAAAQTPVLQWVIPLADGKLILEGTYFSRCLNAWVPIECTYCDEGDPTLCSASGPPDYCDDLYWQYLSLGSRIDNATFNHHHIAWDYRVGQSGSSGCGTCGGGGSASKEPLASLYIQRRHRLRDITEVSSFGPGVFSNYDVRLHLYPSSGGNLAYVFDPRENFPKRLADGMEGDALDGVYHDTRNATLREMRLLDAGGLLTANVNQAATAVVTNYQGIKYTFQIVDVGGGPAQAYYPLNETSGATATDASGNGYNGTNNNATVNQPGQPGATAYAFNGTSSYVDLGNPAGLNFVGQITIGAWVKPQATDGFRNIVVHGYSLSPYGEVFLRIGGGNYQIGSWDGNDHIASAPVPAGDVGTWVYLTGVYDGNTWRLYRNGVEIANSVDSTGAVTVASNWAIGAGTHSGDQRFFSGSIDQVRIYNRGLSANEVANLAGTGGTGYDTPVGRLTSITDRNGYGTTIAYKTFTTAELAAAPDLQWQINTVTDAYGRQATFHYNTAQQSGQWAVSQIDLPNTQNVTYSYSGGKLTGVSHPDGTASTFVYGTDAPTQTTTVTYDDAAAEGTHRRKTAYLTNHIVLTGGPNDNTAVNQSSLLVRMLTNGSGEVGYLNFANPHHVSLNEDVVYEGAGRLKALHGQWTARYYADGWTFPNPSAGYDGLAGSRETTYPDIWLSGLTTQQERQRIWPILQDAQGRQYNYLYDTESFKTQKTYPDATFETWQYNGFKQVTRHKDRLNRVTKSTYDAQGNMLTKQEGILTTLDGGGNDVSNDANQPEHATWTWEYYAAGNANQYLLKDAIDANGHQTDYAYDANHHLTSITEPPDVVAGARGQKTYTYDGVGRVSTSTDEVGRTTTYTYDTRDRVTKITYYDTSTEQNFYGNSTDGTANLIVKTKDRSGYTTKYAFDNDGRVTTTTFAYSTIDAGGTETLITDPLVKTTETKTYLGGTDLPQTVTRSGNTTTYVYDYRQRLVATTVQPKTGTTLTSVATYANNEIVQNTDPYARNAYTVHRASDGEVIRSVQGTVPSEGLTLATVATAGRDTSTNAKYLITDYTKDAKGQITQLNDPRNIATTFAFDSRGRLTDKIEAATTAVAGHTQTVYDAQGNVTDVYSPRNFTEAGGFDTHMTYGGRNLLASRTEAQGRAEAATESWTYYLDMRENVHTDFRGNAWTTTWGFCCGRVQAMVEPAADVDGSGTNKQATHATRFTFSGDLAHEAVAKNFSAITFPTAPGQYLDVPDADTINEVTTRYDARHRPIGRTIWFIPQGAVNPDAVPIAGGGQAGDPAVTISGVMQGLTTSWRYDEDLTDGVGIDADYATQFTAALGSGYFGAGSVGSAVEETNPNGEKMVTVYDGTGRVVLNVDGLLHTKSAIYDVMVGGIGGSQGDLLSTKLVDAIGHTNIRFIDAAGRMLAIRDALNKDKLISFDADSNILVVRDPNSVGQDCLFDARNRKTSCIDTHVDQTQWAYDANSNITSFTDPKGKSDSTSYDGRDRRTSWTSRLAGDTTAWGYDANNNVTSLTDAQSGVTSYTFDARNLKTLEAYPDDDAHLHTGVNDHVTFAWDAARRPRNKLDQAGNTIACVFDMANRLTSRTYPDTNNDTFTYDLASRMLTAASARYNNIVTRTYDAAGRLTADNLTVASTTYNVGIGYDNADRNTSITYPDSSAVDRTYTNRDQLYQVQYTPSGGSVSAVATRTYDDGMRLLTTTYGNSLVETRSYRSDTGGRVDNLIASIAIPSVTGFTYTYDANKNKTAESDGILTNYAWSTGSTGYDDKDRLTNWSRTGGDSQSWNLSLVGDWSNTVVNGTTDTRTHNVVHELLTRSTSATSLAYDPKGNLTTNSNAQTYTWDFDNNMASATVSGITTGYAYDALGRRVSKNTGSTATLFISKLNQEIAEYTGGSLVHKYVFGSYIDEPLLLVAVSGAIETKYYYHANQLYCIAALTNVSGAAVERYAYTPYGEVSVSTGAGADGIWFTADDTYAPASGVGNSYLYTGRRRDVETGLSYYRARYFDPDSGRLLTRDPLGYDDGLGMYTYTRSSPFHFVDPHGTTVQYTQIISPEDAIARIASSKFNKFRWAFPYLGQRTFNPGGADIGNNGFVYTCKYGFIDLGHFFTSAGGTVGYTLKQGQEFDPNKPLAAILPAAPPPDLGKGVDDSIARTYAEGVAVEERQMGKLMNMVNNKKGFDDEGDSAYTPEDLVSDRAGAQFGGQWLRDGKPSIRSEFEKFLREAGAVTVDPEILACLQAEARSWLDKDGHVRMEVRFKDPDLSIAFQHGADRYCYRCLCDGDVPKDQYKWGHK